MGFSLRPLGKKIRDVFDANTEEDQRKRMAAGQPRMYADQQRQMGRSGVGGVAQNAIGSVGRGIARATPIDEAAGAVGGTMSNLANKFSEIDNKETVNNIADRYKDTLNAVATGVARQTNLDKGSEVLGKAMEEISRRTPEVADDSSMRFLNNLAIRPFKTTEANQGRILQGENPYTGSLRQQAGQAGQDVINMASVVPIGKGANLVAKGVNAGLKQTIKAGAIYGGKTGAGFGAAQGLTDANKEELNLPDTVKRVVTNTALGLGAGTALGGGLPIAGRGVQIGAKGAAKGAKISAKATQDAIQAVRNPLRPLNEGGYIRVPNNASDELVKNVYRKGTDANALYHGTKYDNALEILKTGKIKASKPNANRDLIPDNPNAQVSLSRQRNSGFYNSASADVKFVVDKSKVGKTRQYVDGELSPSDYKNPRVFEAEEQTKKDIPLTNIKRIEGGALLEPADEKALRALATKQGIPFVAFDDVKGMRNVLPTQPTKNKLGIKKLNEGGYAKIPKASQLPKVALKQETAPQAPVPENNLVDSLPNNNIADNTKVPLQVTNKDTLLGELKTAMVDKDAPILDYLKGVEKETGQTGLVKQFMYDTGLQRRSSSIANAMMDNSDNLSAAFRGLVGKEKKAFDGYVGARREIQYAKDGLQTSAPVEELQGVVSAGSRFDDRYNALNGYYKEWAGRLHQAGILDDATYKSFTDSGEYTRVQRVMDDLAGFRGSGGNSYSLGTTMTKQKRKGSQRDIQPADLTAMKYAQDSQTEIQRNQTSSNLIDVLASQGHARQVENTTSKNTLSRIVDGKTEIWEVPRDIKEVADNVSPYQLGILSRIIAFPQRLLRAGATGLSAPFTTANYAKDQVSSAAMSENVKVTHQPKNVFNGLYQAAKDFGVGTDDPTWQKFLENLGDTTQYDFLRNQKSAKQFSRELRLGQGGRAINKGLHPIRTVEDLVQITEKATRFQNFKGTYEKALADGVPEAEALQKATLAAWQNSVDFSRMGSVGQVANLLIPYFNAGIQGTRLLVRRTGEAPLATSSKIISFVGLPLAAATFYNMEDEGRKKVYDNISDFEKQNNIIIVLPGAEQHEDGSYSGVVKIPLQPGMSNTVQPLRMAIENYAHDNPQDVLAMSKQFLGAVAGPINTNSISSAVGGLIPQVAKPMVQQVANNDFFTQKQIVPDFIQKATDANGNPVKETDKAYPYTSGTARIIGNATGQSPIRVEKFIKDTSAKVGQYTMNATDNALAKAGIIPDEQIGGISVKEDFARRFAVAQGKENTKKSEGARHYDDINKETATLNGNELAAFNALHPNKKNFLGDTITDMDSVYNSAARLDAYNRYPKVFEVDKRLDAKGRKAGNPGNPLYDLEQWQVKKVLEKENLPPGASDKELSKLHEQDWYNDYSTKKSKFFTDIKNKSASDLETAKAKGDTKKVKALEASITKFNSSDNPYPVTSPDLQKQMDYYSSLPKGTGARKSWIQSNPGLYKQMQDQYAKIDNWQNVQRGKRGLDTTEGDAGKVAGYDTGSSSGGYGKAGYSKSGGGSGGSSSSTYGTNNPYEYAIKLKAGGKAAKPTIKQPTKGKAKIAKKSVGKPKVTSKKSLV